MALTLPHVEHIEASPTASTSKNPLPLYQQSSQFRHWRFTHSQLDQLRTELNAQAVKRVASMVEEDRASKAEASDSTPQPDAPEAKDIEYLTLKDEIALVRFYLTKMSQLCKAFRLPELVEATAATYLKRFYLANTCMDYHPKDIMLTCVFLASKTDNNPIGIDDYCSKLGKTKPEHVLNLEFLLSQSLRFEYKVHHAHVALYGISLDFQTLGITPVENSDSLSQKWIKTARQCDVEFVYPPSQIAAAAMRLVDPEGMKKWIDSKLDRASATGTSPEVGALEAVLDTIQAELEEAERTPTGIEIARDIDKRLKWASNPEKNPNSALFKKRQAEADAEEMRKAGEKAAKRPKLDDADPFR